MKAWDLLSLLVLPMKSMKGAGAVKGAGVKGGRSCDVRFVIVMSAHRAILQLF